MGEVVRFFFDPLCPWCYQTSRWARRVERLGEITLDWGLFSLELANAGGDNRAAVAAGSRSRPALRTCVAVRTAAGPRAVGGFYAAVGARHHERGEPLDDPAVLRAALADAGLEPALYDLAVAEERTWEAVEAEHHALVERTRSFGVPTLVLDGGQGPAIFGPVIGEVPDDGDALELWRHVGWLARYADFSELKRQRGPAPDLASVRARRRPG